MRDYDGTFDVIASAGQARVRGVQYWFQIGANDDIVVGMNSVQNDGQNWADSFSKKTSYQTRSLLSGSNPF